MNKTKDYSGIVMIANHMKPACQFLDYDWRNQDEDLLPFKMKVEPKIQKRIRELGEHANIDQIGDLSEGIYTVSDWNNFKKIYDFHPAFVEYLMDTESSKVSSDLWKRLPFRSFYIWVGLIDVPAIQYGMDKSVNMKYAWGMFIRVHQRTDGIILGLELTGNQTGDFRYPNDRINDWKSVGFVLEMPEGTNFDTALDWYIDSRKGIESFDPKRITEVKDFWRPFFRIGINACQYLCASNAEIHDVHISKKDRPVVMTGNKKKAVNIQVSNVGYQIGKRFEDIYLESNAETRRNGVKGIKKRPHIRRAHWHHYWTGPGRTTLEVRWIEPVFVVGSEEDIDIVVHEVRGNA